MKRIIYVLILFITIMIITACGPQSETKKEPEYESTKKMVVDILNTEEGRKALTKAINDDKFTEQMMIDADETRKAIESILTSDKGEKMWKKLFENTEFRATYAKSMAEEHKKIMKSLMKDPEFQGQVLALFKNPEVTKQMVDAMKSKQFRSHLETVIEETMDSPSFQKKFEDALKKASEKSSGKSNKKDNKKSSDGQPTQ